MDPRYVIPAVLAALVVALIVAVVVSFSGSGNGPRADAAPRHLPPYWTVHSGDSYSVIADKTGLTVDQLETFNPYTNPSTIVPGQRLKLRLHVPKPKPKPKGPRFHTVRSGESFGSIAVKTHHNITALQRLNPKLKPAELQPGTRMRLRK